MQEKSKKNNQKESAEYLSGFITENKKERIKQVLGNRTRYLTVVLEDIFQPHNASAVIRSCDCFGIQDLHVIENQNEFKVNADVALGASKWVDVIRYTDANIRMYANNTNEEVEREGKGRGTGDEGPRYARSSLRGRRGTRACIETLREQGYRIVATAPCSGKGRGGKGGNRENEQSAVGSRQSVKAISQKCYSLDYFPLDKGKIALFFGTEMDGLSDEALKNADEFLKIPMYGFTESLNISVCVAICLHHLTIKLHGSELKWRLSEKEKREIELKWIMKIIKGKKD